MKTLFISTVLFFCSITYGQEEGKADCGWYGTKTVQERNMIFPFDKAKKVILISYSNHEMGNPLQTRDPSLFSIEKAKELNPDVISKIVFVSENFRPAIYFTLEEVVLNQESINELSNIFCNYVPKLYKDEGYISASAMCYTPRNSILFFDEKGEIISCFEVCFECGNSGFWPDPAELNQYDSTYGCEEKKAIMKEFFRKNGITYGVEDRY